MNKLKLLAISVCAVLGLASNASFAAGHASSGNVGLSLTISDACSINSSGINGNMGSHSAGTVINSGNNISIGDLEITCATDISYSWGISGGKFMAAPGTSARMRKGSTASYIDYSIEMSATADVGNRVGDKGLNAIDVTYPETNIGANAITGTGTALTQPIALYLNPVDENTVPPGRYTDIIIFTVVWP
jgi:spore coat protein U-like protein